MSQTEANTPLKFNPNEHLTLLKNKDYLEVKWRLVWFRDRYPHGVITTSVVLLDLEKQVAVFKAHIEDGEGGMGEGHGSESAKDFLDYIEKAETKAQGRALAALGYGTQFAPELEEGERLADSPVTNGSGQDARSHSEKQTSRRKVVDAQATPAKTPYDQINALLKEYNTLRPEDCTAKNWHWQKLRVALAIPTGPLPEVWTSEHVKALDSFVGQHRKVS